MARRKKQSKKSIIVTIILLLLFAFYNKYETEIKNFIFSNAYKSYSIEEIPAYNGENYVVINNNEPSFTENDLSTESFETYSSQDALGRSSKAYANIGIDLILNQLGGIQLNMILLRGNIYIIDVT